MSEPIYIPNVRAIKGLAPTALQFNALANNLEFLNTRKIPRCCSLKLNANATLTRSLLTGYAIFSFDTVILDTDTMFSGGILTPPSDSKFVRMIVSLQFSSFANREFAVYTSLTHPVGASGASLFPMAFQMGAGATSDGVAVCQVDSGWVPYTAGATNYQTITVGLVAGSSPATLIAANSATWLSLEVV